VIVSGLAHIVTDYLDYYCGLEDSPGFAVLLKGEWGSGKTWFINKYREKLEAEIKKDKQDKRTII
jgi:tRNA A37 threonylcarbamoyladenosine biosynthesis protein TsaE